MRTININLLGELGTTQKKAHTQKLSLGTAGNIDPKTKSLAITFVGAATAVFSVSLLAWIALNCTTVAM